MGKSSKTTVGYHYRIAYHAGLCGRPVDVFLEYRAADKRAWAGRLTETSTVRVHAPELFGGEKDQGGIDGPIEVMFGDEWQEPSVYLQGVLGPQVVAWRGMTTFVFAGGRYGAMSPFPQKPAYKIRKILRGWDEPGPWYPEKAAVGPPDIDEPVETFHLEFPLIPIGDPDYPPGSYSLDDWGSRNLHPKSYTIGPYPHRVAIRMGDADGADQGFFDDVLVFNGVPGQGPGILAVIEANQTVVIRLLNLYESWCGGDGQITVFEWDTTTLGMNPAHILYYNQTDSERGREPRASINDANMRAAADMLAAEGFGLCCEFNPAQDSVDSFRERICRLIGGSFQRSLEDGEWYLDLARGAGDPSGLPVITDDDILDYKELPTTLEGATNSIAVRYFDPERKESVITPAVRALGLIRVYGEIHETLDAPEIPAGGLARRYAERELRARITPARAWELTLVPTPPVRAIRVNQYFVLHSVRRGIPATVCIMGERDAGKLTSGAIRVKVTEDIYSMPDGTYIEVEDGVGSGPPPIWQPIVDYAAFEAPWFWLARVLRTADLEALEPESGFAMAVAADPGNHLDYAMYVRDPVGEFALVASGDWCATAVAATALDLGATSVTVIGVRGGDTIVPGRAVLVGNEWCRVTGYTADTGTLSLGRGCGDTIRHEHAAGTRLWFVDADVVFDPTEYAEGETVDVALVSNTGSSRQPVVAATPIPVTIEGRALRPYPPAFAQINYQLPPPASVTGPFAVSWRHRDRATQADQLVDDQVASVTPDPMTRYGMRVLDDADNVLLQREDIGGDSAWVTVMHTGQVMVELWTIGQAGESLQRWQLLFDHVAPAGGTPGIDADTWQEPTIVIDGNDPP